MKFLLVMTNAELAEELGYDGYGVGERHERPFTAVTTFTAGFHVARTDVAPALRREIPAPAWPA